mgnify:CR=1 FL=1
MSEKEKEIEKIVDKILSLYDELNPELKLYRFKVGDEENAERTEENG